MPALVLTPPSSHEKHTCTLVYFFFSPLQSLQPVEIATRSQKFNDFVFGPTCDQTTTEVDENEALIRSLGLN